MKLEQQVCSLELAKKLKELGVKQESYFAWARIASKRMDGNGYDWDTYGLVKNDFQAEIEYISAFTVAELGEMLHKYTECWNFYMGFGLGLSSAEYKIGLSKSGYKEVEFRDLSEADARAKMLIYLLENKLISL